VSWPVLLVLGLLLAFLWAVATGKLPALRQEYEKWQQLGRSAFYPT
jgi:membrane-associated phospholipid phosphatase